MCTPSVDQTSFPKSPFNTIVFALAILLRFISFSFSSNTGGDAWAREGITATWLQHPSLQLNFGPWLPFHFWLMGGFATILGGNVRIAGRLLSLLAGTASLFVFYKLVRTVFDDEAAQLGLVVFSLCSLDIAYSATSSSEAVYILFVLLGLLGYFHYRQLGKPQTLTFSGIFFSFAAATRYEAWSLIFAVAVLILVSVWRTSRQAPFSKAVRPFLLFALTAGFFPVLIMINNWTKFHSLIYGVAMNHEWVAEQVAFAHVSTLYRLSLFPGVLLLTLTPIVIVGALYGFFLSFRTAIGAEFALVTVFFGAVQLYQIAAGGEMAFARYTITLGTLLIPLGALGLAEIFRQFPGKSRALRQAFVGILLLNLLAIWVLSATRNRFSEKAASISPILRYPHRIESLAAFLQARLERDDHIVIDDYNSESNIVAQALGLPLPTTSRAFLASLSPASELRVYVEQQHPRYFIYAQKGVLEKTLPLECGLPPGFSSADVRCTYQNDVYRVYEVSYR
jgi:4-amino-4-deoxy-L-arabinose transferase-like glycosyltransferase